jgi:hypothetical protein
MADERVNIQITATDNASATIGKITGSLSSMDKIIQSQVLKDVGVKMTQAFNWAKNEVKGLTSELDNYVQETRKISMLTGTSTEEASRMIQVADDQRVSVEELTMALRMAAQKGLTPNIEGLAKLADQYNALPTAADRAAFAQENFGRGWVNMAKLLGQGGDAIRENAAAIDASLIIDQKAVDATDALYKAQDDLGDALTGVKLELATALLPAMQSLAEFATNTLIPAIKGIVDIFMGLPEPVRNIVIGLGGITLALGAMIGPALQAFAAIAQISVLFKAGGLLAGAPAMLTGLVTTVRGLGVAAYAALGPWGLLAAAVAGLIYVIMTYGPQALETLDKMALLAGRLVFGDAWFLQQKERLGYASGGYVQAGIPITVGERGSETFVPDQPGMILPHGTGAGGANIYITINETVGIANQAQAQSVLLPYIMEGMRRAGVKVNG